VLLSEEVRVEGLVRSGDGRVDEHVRRFLVLCAYLVKTLGRADHLTGRAVVDAASVDHGPLLLVRFEVHLVSVGRFGSLTQGHALCLFAAQLDAGSEAAKFYWPVLVLSRTYGALDTLGKVLLSGEVLLLLIVILHGGKRRHTPLLLLLAACLVVHDLDV
jgi:hypothetical protein